MNEAEPQPQIDRTEQFVAQLGQVQVKLHAYVMSLMPSWSDADEIMQRTSVALWRKFETYEPDTSFLAWARAVALIEVKRFRQASGRDRLVFSDDLLDLLDSTVESETDRLDAEREALSLCLSKLTESEQSLVNKVYAGEQKITEVCSQLGISAGAAYTKLHRARRGLLECITVRLKQEGWL